MPRREPKNIPLTDKEIEDMAKGPANRRCILCEGELKMVYGTKQGEFEYRFNKHMQCAKDIKDPCYKKFIAEWDKRKADAIAASKEAQKMAQKSKAGEVNIKE